MKMKNKILKITILTAILLGSMSFANLKRVNPVIVKVSSKSSNSQISLDRAKKIAFKHAGVSEKNVQMYKSKLDWENGKRVYEIEFYSNNAKYEYDIDARNGQIVSFSKKDINTRNNNNGRRNNNNNNNNNSRNYGGYIGEQNARRIALSRVPGANNSHIRKIKLDREDGRMVYEGEIKYNGQEYEFDIDAVTGRIIKWERD